MIGHKSKKRILSLAVALLTVTASFTAVALTAGPASAQFYGEFILHNKATGLCLQADGAGTAVSTTSCDNSGNTWEQDWTVGNQTANNTDTSFTVLDGGTMFLISNFDAQPLYTAVQAVTSQVDLRYYWSGINNGNGTWTFISAQFPGSCLDSNAQGHAYGHSCNGGAYQQWGLAATTCAGACAAVASHVSTDRQNARLYF